LRNKRSDVQPEIASSQEMFIEENTSDHRQKRAVVVTVTSTITAYSFSTTTVIKSFTLISPVAQSLACLPAGYTVC
jgi:hypothetical protein